MDFNHPNTIRIYDKDATPQSLQQLADSKGLRVHHIVLSESGYYTIHHLYFPQS